mmetsp:Transcript_26747/g.54715  ORF Transcript_26747/g.54715 Transcript_26747/m.54715 type:complete len:358 (-) Transcript_26747:255-1328(-)|eukprot:CAMPEP_0183308916 /NCGR_PEP_ID=MMETSP0160_2-20130417/22985_1 /TAXON_ID=2839 ORGANISM="Odontella Sinensis, Strain Grunow 1884" /NCGR_SAMPLE_ID=MMETSP0160_2 /ASSEMBLY_ACC=CAM_ASM_000250 /LENGTH=357 /DNA_ID=CAMNT_0025472837 /DNA_START=44 /DNA_END=1117 /DNA_ORIENTATION=+
MAQSGWGYAPHAPPVLEENEEVSIIRVPNEDGYFPTGTRDAPALFSCEAQLFQMLPKYEKEDGEPIASGTFMMRDPSVGTASEVALVCECDGTSFYVMSDDATQKVGATEFMLLLPEDCIGVHLADATPPELVLHFEGLLAARTKFHDESSSVDAKERFPEHLPEDRVSRTMFNVAKWTSKQIVATGGIAAQKMEKYGQKKRDSITEVQEKNIKSSQIKLAKGARTVSEKTAGGVQMISDAIATKIGSSVGKHATPKEGDSKAKQQARALLVASTISYEEVSDGIGEGYNIMMKSAKEEAVSFVSSKYGKEAAELARHTAGAAGNFGQAALTARRVVNVKMIAKSIAKQQVKNAIMK